MWICLPCSQTVKQFSSSALEIFISVNRRIYLFLFLHSVVNNKVSSTPWTPWQTWKDMWQPPWISIYKMLIQGKAMIDNAAVHLQYASSCKVLNKSVEHSASGLSRSLNTSCAQTEQPRTLSTTPTHIYSSLQSVWMPQGTRNDLCLLFHVHLVSPQATRLH